MVEHNLAMVRVASSSLVSRSKIDFIAIKKKKNGCCGTFFRFWRAERPFFVAAKLALANSKW